MKCFKYTGFSNGALNHILHKIFFTIFETNFFGISLMKWNLFNDVMIIPLLCIASGAFSVYRINLRIEESIFKSKCLLIREKNFHK